TPSTWSVLVEGSLNRSRLSSSSVAVEQHVLSRQLSYELLGIAKDRSPLGFVTNKSVRVDQIRSENGAKRGLGSRLPAEGDVTSHIARTHLVEPTGNIDYGVAPVFALCQLYGHRFPDGTERIRL